MIIRKNIQGTIIHLKLELIKRYKHYSLYQVYKLVKDKWVATYQTTYTHLQIQNMINKNYLLYDMEEEDNKEEETEELICL